MTRIVSKQRMKTSHASPNNNKTNIKDLKITNYRGETHYSKRDSLGLT